VVDGKRVLSHLRRLPLLAPLPLETVAALAEHARALEVKRRDVIYLPGDPGNAVFAIVAGRVRLSKVSRDGKSLTLAYVGTGDLFGEACVEAASPRSDMAEASEACQLIQLERDAVERALDASPQLARTLLRLVLARRRELEAKLEGLLFRDVNSKLAELLMQLGERHGVDDARGTMVALQITHQEMANLIGSTRETVSLTLSQWKRQRLIVTEGRRVILSDRDALRAMY
jgi:CRP/FNR family cyclic AMP-dependent transcriptional regulator